MTVARSVSPSRVCLARTLPTTTGLTASRCDGLAVRLRWTMRPPGISRSVEVPRWYLTSPEPSTSSITASPWNSEKICGDRACP